MENEEEQSMRKRLISCVLAFLMLVTILPVSTQAAETLSADPYARVEYGYSASVSVGTIRYMSQNVNSSYFNWNYWPTSAFGGYSGPGSECGTCSISMALSYIGINKTPNEILSAHNGQTYFSRWGATMTSPSVAQGMSNYISGNGKYSPVVIHLPKYSSAGHYVILAGKVSDGVYQVVDPYKDSVWDITISGATAYYNGITDYIDATYQYYNPNAEIAPHTCDRGEYLYYEAAHPHYKAYKCSVCGKTWRDTSAPTMLASCEQCYPREAAITYYDADGAVWTTADSAADQSYTLEPGYPVKAGSYFTGWSYAAGASTFDLRPNDTVTVKGSTNLYPVYVTREQAVSGEAVYIYNISDFAGDGYQITPVERTVKTRVDNSGWGSWSDYSGTEVSENATTQVRTAPLYRYYYFLCPSCGAHEPFWGTSDCGATIPEDAWHVKWCTTPYTSCSYQTFSYTSAKYYTTSLGDGQLWCFSAGNLYDTAIGTKDAAGDDLVIKAGYSARYWETKYATAERAVTAYQITKISATAGMITVTGAQARRGQNVTVSLELRENQGISNMRLQLQYPDCFTLESIQRGDALKKLSFTAPGDLTENPVNLLWDGVDADQSDGTILKLTFRVSDTAAEGDYTIRLNCQKGDVLDGNLEDAALQLQQGTVSVVSFTYGDVNNDGEINMKDLGMLRRYLAGGYDLTDFVSEAADVNGDGEVTVKDLGILRRYLAGGYDIALGG